MINDVNFSEEIEKIAAVYLSKIQDDFDEAYMKFEFYNIFSAIRKKCIEKWYIAELKFYPDGTWNIEFVYGEIPEVEDDEE